jgi:predicted enzyme related to lactoylglutathione lyase
MKLKFSEIQIFVTDQQKALDFYGNCLGLPLKEKGSTKGTSFLIFDLGCTELVVMSGAVRKKNTDAYKKECSTVLCFETDNMEKTFFTLKLRGVIFLTEVQLVEQGKWIAFQDPDGNLFELIEPPKK